MVIIIFSMLYDIVVICLAIRYKCSKATILSVYCLRQGMLNI